MLRKSMKLFYYIILILTISSSQSCFTQNESIVLEYKIRHPKSKIKNPPVLFLLHGLGSNEDDLFQLADFIHDDYLVIFPRAPYLRSPDTYKWYDLTFINGKPVSNSDEVNVSTEILRKFVNQIKKEYSIDQKNIILGGFSQGAIMSYNLGLTTANTINGIIALSGQILEQTKSNINNNNTQYLKTLIIHGTQDKVLPIHYARQAKEFLELNNFEIDYLETNIGHSINQQTIIKMNEWLNTFM